MKKFIASLALAMFFTTGAVWAGEGHGEGEGCGHDKKWEDT